MEKPYDAYPYPEFGLEPVDFRAMARKHPGMTVREALTGGLVTKAQVNWLSWHCYNGTLGEAYDKAFPENALDRALARWGCSPSVH